jgi:DNA-binding IclR family transcriptional regulator
VPVTRTDKTVPAKQEKYRVNSVYRVVQIMDCLARASAEGLTRPELQASLNLKKSTLFVLLATLLDLKMVTFNDISKRYRLGTRVLLWAGEAEKANELRYIGLKHLEKLTGITRETSHLAVLDGNEILFIEKVESLEPLKMSSTVGARHPLQAPAPAKVLFAFQDREIRNKLAGEIKFKKHTENSIRSKKEYMERALETARTGFAVDDEELLIGTRCLAGPVFNRQNKICAAIGITAPALRFTRERIPEMASSVLKVAREFSFELGASEFDFPETEKQKKKRSSK